MRTAKDTYIAQVTAAFAEFANAHHGQTLSKAEIDEGARALMRDGDLHGYCVSDFARGETDEHRSRNNPTLFERIEGENGAYIVL